ncbi:MAG: hypothetical protein QXX08_11005 [Candidatus Bathyarchaeia archaeon]
MESRISQIILNLYQIREDPINNFDKIPSILDQLGFLGIEYPDLAKILEYRTDVERISEPLKESISLKKCVERYLSETEPLKIEEIRELRNYARQLYSEVSTYIQHLERQSQLLRLKITKDNHQMIEDLLQKLIGHRLEIELIPNLLEKMGYERNTTTFNISDKVVEIDGRYERNFYSGIRNERLRKKDVVIVECKATIDLDEIKKFQTKIEIIKGKYIKDKENWGYDELDFRAWIVACYGWTKELFEEARKRDIAPISSAELERELRKFGIFDPRIPICPTSD